MFRDLAKPYWKAPATSTKIALSYVFSMLRDLDMPFWTALGACESLRFHVFFQCFGTWLASVSRVFGLRYHWHNQQNYMKNICFHANSIVFTRFWCSVKGRRHQIFGLRGPVCFAYAAASAKVLAKIVFLEVHFCLRDAGVWILLLMSKNGPAKKS